MSTSGDRSRAWRTQNPERARARDHAYYQANKDRIRAYGIEYRARNRDRRRAQHREYLSKHANELRAQRHRKYADNAAAIREQRRAYRAAHKDHINLAGRLRRYNISPTHWQSLWDATGGRCHSCGGPFATPTEAHVDHDHACCPARNVSCGRCVRGLLCTGCNTGIGSFADDPARLEAAIRYLASPPCSHDVFLRLWKDDEDVR
jgi:hypothetical protein